jgi:hypothetical protein
VSEHGLAPLAAQNGSRRIRPGYGKINNAPDGDGGYTARRSPGTKRKASGRGEEPVLKQKLMEYPKNNGDIPKKWLDLSFFLTGGNWFDEEKR